jgi:hypothetical protein
VCLALGLAAAAASLVSLATTERLLAAVGREAVESRYGAEAIAGYALGELRLRASWTTALDGSAPAALTDTTRTPVVGGARRLDLEALGRAFGPVEPGAWGADQPAWRLFAWGPASRLAPGLLASPVYVAAWVADDERDGDRNPGVDSNGRLLLRAEAFGPVRGRRGLVIVIVRAAAAPAALKLLDWRPI